MIIWFEPHVFNLVFSLSKNNNVVSMKEDPALLTAQILQENGSVIQSIRVADTRCQW